jgi:hypothetical protein
MSPYKPVTFSSFLKGLNASTVRTSQPQGTLPRLSNFVLTRRGGIVTCDGSKIVNAFNGVPTAGRGRDMATVLFSPTGVLKYYLRLMKALDIPLGPPRNLTLGTAGGGTLPAATYYYKVTAVDNAGGETTSSNEANIATGANGQNTLTWNVVPNAQGYNIYRGTAPGLEGLLSGVGVPVPQVGVGTLTVSFIDTGSLTAPSVGIPIFNVQHITGDSIVIWQTVSPVNLSTGAQFTAAGTGVPGLDGIKTVLAVFSPTAFSSSNTLGVGAYSSTTGTVTSTQAPPLTDNTQQTGLYKMPPAVGGISYNNSNLVALFPADLPILDGGIGGGGGGHGGTGGGGSGQQGSTPSGGIPGNVSFIPQMVQFQNQMAIALGNALAPQVYRDSTGTLTNPANVSPITAISVDAFGVVTVTAAHNLIASQVGGSVILVGVINNLYNGTFVTISVGAGTVKLYNPSVIGQAASSGGNMTVTSTPIISTFTTAYPTWATGLTYLVGDIIVPTVLNGHYYKCIQAGVSATQPVFPTASGAQVPEAGVSPIIWQEAGLTNTTAPPPPGAAHITVYAGSLWAWDTWYTNTANGLDGPTSLRMCDGGNLNSWNPINQAFIDKDDGTEGMGIGAFTITGFGIPPEGSLIAFKNYTGYQIVGVFGSSNFLIQRIKSDLGCTAPRTIQFLTGYGLMRFSHLGFTLFDGINDRVMSEDIKDYIFPTVDPDTSDIVSIDFNWMPIAWASQTVYPPMYIAAVPIGNSGGKLTRLLCFDLVLKSWAGPTDLPFAISTLYQARPTTQTAVTLLGTYNDGALHRWSAGDTTWDNSIDTPGPSPVNWMVETQEVFIKEAIEARFYCKQLSTVGKVYNSTITFNQVEIDIQDETSYTDGFNLYPTLGGSFVLVTAINQSSTHLHCKLTGSGPLEITSFGYSIEPEDPIVPPRLT